MVRCGGSIPVTPELERLRRLRQEVLNSEPSLDYIASSYHRKTKQGGEAM